MWRKLFGMKKERVPKATIVAERESFSIDPQEVQSIGELVTSLAFNTGEVIVVRDAEDIKNLQEVIKKATTKKPELEAAYLAALNRLLRP